MVSAAKPLNEPALAGIIDSHSKQTWWQDLLLLSLVLMIFFGAFLGSRPLTVPDEGRYAEIPREMVTSGDYVTPRINGVKYFEKPPFFYWMQSASVQALGFNEWAVRLPNALMGLLGVLLVYGTARTLYTRRAGLLAAMTLGTFGLYTAMAHMVTLDMTVAALISGSLCCFLIGVQNPAGPRRSRWMWAMFSCAALATLTKGLIAIIFPSMIIFLWVLMTSQWREIKSYCIPTGFILLTAITLPWHILVQLKNPEFFQYYIIDQQFLRYLTDISRHDHALWFLPLVLFGGLFPWTGFIVPAILHALPKQWRNHRKAQANLFLLLWAGLIFLFFWKSNSQLAPYVLPIYPPLAIILGYYFDWAIDHPRHWGIRFGYALMALLSLTLLVVGSMMLDLSQTAINTTLGLLGVAALLPLLIYWRSNLLRSFVSLSLAISLFFVSIIFSYPPTDTRSVKTLATTLKPLLKEGDTVYSYQDHYQDLPFYLGQRVVMVEFYGELWHGLAHIDPKGIWMPQDKFWPLWSNSTRQFMIMNLSDYKVAVVEHKEPMYEIARTRRNILLSNIPPSRNVQRKPLQEVK